MGLVDIASSLFSNTAVPFTGTCHLREMFLPSQAHCQQDCILRAEKRAKVWVEDGDSDEESQEPSKE